MDIAKLLTENTEFIDVYLAKNLETPEKELETLSEYLKEKRLEYALTLIKSGITGTAELAELCGYKDPLYFSKCFKKFTGRTPTEYGRSIIK